MSVKNGALEVLYFDKTHGKIGKRVVTRVMPRLATGPHVTLPSISKHFMFFSRSGYAEEAGRDVKGSGYILVGRDRRGKARRHIGRVCTGRRWCVEVVGSM